MDKRKIGIKLESEAGQKVAQFAAEVAGDRPDVITWGRRTFAYAHDDYPFFVFRQVKALSLEQIAA